MSPFDRTDQGEFIGQDSKLGLSDCKALSFRKNDISENHKGGLGSSGGQMGIRQWDQEAQSK